jgi:peroxiredoxin
MDEPTPGRQLTFLLVGLLIGAAFIIIAAFGMPETSNEPPVVRSPGVGQGIAAGIPQVGSLAPDFVLEDLSGRAVSLGDFRGEVVLLNFWAVWCEPCRVEMPLLENRYDGLKDEGFVVLGVDFDDPAADVLEYRQDLSLTFPLLLDVGGDVQDLYRIRGYPSSVIVDREGKVQIVHIGVMTEKQLDGYLEELGF